MMKDIVLADIEDRLSYIKTTFLSNPTELTWEDVKELNKVCMYYIKANNLSDFNSSKDKDVATYIGEVESLVKYQRARASRNIVTKILYSDGFWAITMIVGIGFVFGMLTMLIWNDSTFDNLHTQIEELQLRCK